MIVLDPSTAVTSFLCVDVFHNEHWTQDSLQAHLLLYMFSFLSQNFLSLRRKMCLVPSADFPVTHCHSRWTQHLPFSFTTLLFDLNLMLLRSIIITSCIYFSERGCSKVEDLEKQLKNTELNISSIYRSIKHLTNERVYFSQGCRRRKKKYGCSYCQRKELLLYPIYVYYDLYLLMEWSCRVVSLIRKRKRNLQWTWIARSW